MIYFTADNHFWHKNIIDFCNRPFTSVEDMNDEMVERWNMIVNRDDQVYITGDFALAGVDKTTEIIKRLVGYKILIMGNHDHRNHAPNKWLKMGMNEVDEYRELTIAGSTINISHFPYKKDSIDERIFESQMNDDGKILIHGHVHNSWKMKKRMINVGVDQWDFTPVPYKKIEHLVKAIK